MTLEIITPSKILCSKDNLSQLKAPGICGDFGVWNNHASFVTMLGDGIVSCIDENKEEIKIRVKDGFFGVIDNKITILAEEGEILE